MGFLKKMWQRIAAGESPGRVFRHNGKLYIANKVFDTLAVSRSTKKDFFPIVDGGILTVNFIVALVSVIALFSDIPLPLPILLIVIGLWWFVVNFLMLNLISSMIGISMLSVLRTKRPMKIYEYAGKKSEDLLKIVPHLSNEEIAMMIDHVIELEEIDELIAKAEAHLQKEDSSILDNEIMKQLSHLRKRSEEINNFRFNVKVRSVYDEETLSILEEMSKATQSAANLVNSSVRGDKTIGKNDEDVQPVEIEVLSGNTAHVASR